MTFAGKKLQDIYDSGADCLAELEVEANNKLKQLKERQAVHLKTSSKECSERIECVANDLKGELGACIDGSLERLKGIIDSEIDRTKTHSLHLVAELSKLSEKLHETIATLKKNHQGNLDHLRTDASEKYLGVVERTQLELKTNAYAAVKNIRAQGTFVANSLQQKFDHVIWESRGDEKQVTGSLFKSYMQKANAIDSHFSTLIQKLSLEFQNQYKAMESSAKRAEGDVEVQWQSVLDEADEHAVKMESQFSEQFKKLSEQHRQKLDSDLAAIADDLSHIHDSTTEMLAKTADRLSESLMGASAQTRDSLEKRCRDGRGKVDASIEELASRLAERLRVGEALKLSLENDRDGVINNIRLELAKIKEMFEQRVLSLTANASERVKNMSSEVEAEINRAKENGDKQLVAEGQSMRKEIEAEVTNFLKLLGQHRMAALAEVADAAGEADSFPTASSEKRSGNKKVSRKETELEGSE